MAAISSISSARGHLAARVPAGRTAAAAGLVAVAVLHVAAAGPEKADAPGLFWLFLALAAGCAVMAIRLLLGAGRWTWSAVLALALVPTAGYLLSRTTGLPGAADDVGDWLDPLGVASIAVQAALIAGSATALLRGRRGAPYFA